MAKLRRLNLVTGLPTDSGDVASIDSLYGYNYEDVAASATAQVLGSTGAVGDFCWGLLVIPGTTSAGSVTLIDGALTGVVLFTGGVSSVPNLIPFLIRVNILSVNGAWKVTTGTNVSVRGIGLFT